MTSLPQTSPSRLAPRPTGTNGHLALHGGGMGAPPLGANTLTGADVWRVIRANFWMILATLAVAGVLGYLANMFLLAKFSRYTSTGFLSVMTAPDIARGNDYMGGGINPAELEIDQRTNAKLLVHDRLLSDVLASSAPIRQTSWFNQFVTFKNGQQVADADAAKADLLEHLDVTPVPNSRLIQVRMSYSVPKDCQTIVQELCNQFIINTRKQQSGQQGDRYHALQQLVDDYRSHIESDAQTMNATIRDLSERGVSIVGTSRLDIELTGLVQEQMRVNAEAGSAKAALDMFEQQAKAGNVPEVERDVSQNSGVASYRQQVDYMDMQVNDFAIRYGPNHTDTKSAKSRLEQLKNKLADEEARVRDQTTQYYRSILQQKAAGAAAAKHEIDQRVTGLTAEIAELTAKRNEVERLSKDRDEYRAKLDKVKDEQDKLGLIMGNEKLAPVEWSAQPDLPDHPSFPRLSIVMGLAMMLGLALSLGIAFLREMTDTSVRSPRDVARVGQMTLLGMIPHVDDDPQIAGARLPLAIYEAPHSMVAEQFRQVRTRLQHIASLDTTRSILVTGCSPEDGKTMVAANLAAGLALNGRRILLVDANFRRPSIHTVFAVNNQYGFGDVLNEPASFDEAVRATEVPNLSVMPLGNRPTNATELLESQLLIDFIERALEEYDHVIFDGGPLLMVSDAIALAPRVDGVVTVVRARGNSRGLLQRVRDELRRLKAEHLGVILNAVRVQGGGYYGPMIKTYYAYQNR